MKIMSLGKAKAALTIPEFNMLLKWHGVQPKTDKTNKWQEILEWNDTAPIFDV